MKTRRALTFVLLLAAATGIAAQTAADRETLAKIRTEGMERSQTLPVFEMLTTVIERLTDTMMAMRLL